MSSIAPGEHAARLLEYYIRALVERSGLRWAEANTADFDQLGELLDQAGDNGDTIPPYHTPPARPAPQLDTKVTQVLDTEETAQWQAFRRWQADRALDERDDQARRMLRR